MVKIERPIAPKAVDQTVENTPKEQKNSMAKKPITHVHICGPAPVAASKNAQQSSRVSHEDFHKTQSRERMQAETEVLNTPPPPRTSTPPRWC